MKENKPSTQIKKDLKKFTALQALSISEGGKILKDTCLKDIVSCVDSIAYYSKVPSLEDFISISARLNEKLAMYRVLKNAKKNIELTEIALIEALEQEEE